MDNDFNSFIDTLESHNTIKVVNSLRTIGKYDYSDCTLADLEKIILSMKPNSLRSITTICYVIGLYAKFLNNEKLYNIIQEVEAK